MNEHETSADIIADMRTKAECAKPYDDGIVMMLTDYADRFEAALKRERGDCAKMREALKMVRDAHYTKEVKGELCEGFEVEADDGTGRPLICVVEDALAAPPRNCDAYNNESCRMAYHLHGDGLMTMQAFADWLFTPATEK